MENKISVIAIKSADGELILEVLGAPFGGPFNGKDSQGDYFDKDTNVYDKQYPEIPVIYAHGFDPATRKQSDKPIIIGKATHSRQDEHGHWYHVVLDKANSIAQRIWQAALKGLAKASSGAINYLVRRAEDGRLIDWPIGEMTLVDISEGLNPANPYAIAVPLLKMDYELAGMKIELEDAGDASTQNNNNNENKKDTTMTEEEKKAAEAKAKAEAEAKAKEEAEKAAKANLSGDVDLSGIMQEVIDKQNEKFAQKTAQEKRRQTIQGQLQELVENITMKITAPATNNGAPALNLKTKRGDDANKAFEYFMRTGDKGAYKALVIMNEGDDESGGAAVPTDFYNQVVMLRDPLSIVRQAGARVVKTSGLTINIPIYNTRFTAPAATNESAAATAVSRTINQVEPLDTKAVTVSNYTFLLRLSEELVNDAKFDIIGFVQQAIAQNYGVLENSLLVTELKASCTNTISGADDITVTVGDLFNVYYDIDAPYRDGASWIMKGSTEGAIRQLVTASAFAFGVTPQGQSGSVGQQWLIGPGNRVFNAADMDAIGTALKPIFFGNFQHYAVVENGTLTVKRLNERFADTGEIGFVASLRTAHKLLHTEAFTYLLNLNS